MRENLTCGFVFTAWAKPILNKAGLREPMAFRQDFPKAPNTDAQYTYMDADGTVVPAPNYTTPPQCLPEFCFVQYAMPPLPPPPYGYQYVRSELERDVCSAEYHLYHEIGTPRPGIEVPAYGLAPVCLTELERAGMVSNLRLNKEGYYSLEDQSLISNFTVQPIRLVRNMGRKGLLDELLEYRVKLGRRLGNKTEQISVNELDRIVENIRASYAGADVSPRFPKAGAKIAYHIRNSLLELPTVERYIESGWYRLNGTWVYAQDGILSSNGAFSFDTGYRIAAKQDLNQADAMQAALGMLQISKEPKVIVPLALYAHLGVMFTLFEEAGFPPRMVMFVNGKTGSLKTAVCSVMFNLTGEIKRNIPASFRDTVASIEAKFPDYADKVLLLDDYSPATTAKSRAEMNKLLEDIIRYFGDGKGRSRSNISVDKAVSTVPRGLCCITGEDTGGSQSSLLRCIVIDVANGTFDGKLLTPYQSDPTLWSSHFAYFVSYLSAHFEELRDEIRYAFPQLRNELHGILRAGRIVDSAACLCLTGQILLRYGVDIRWISDSNAAALLAEWNAAVIEAVKISEVLATDLDPVQFYLSSLFDAVDSGAEKIAPSKDSFLQDTSALGYKRNDEWHLWPERLYALALNRCKVQRKNFPLSMSKIHAALAEAHIIQYSCESRAERAQKNYLLRESFGNRPRMLVIDVIAAQRYLRND